MCGSLDKLTESLENLESLGEGRMKGEASPFSWMFRFYLDRTISDIVSLLTYQRSREEIEYIDDIYNVVASIRSAVRESDRTYSKLAIETLYGETSPLEAEDGLSPDRG